jgi:hypothetical protein
MFPVAFVRRPNPDGSQTSSCPKCQNVVTIATAEIIIEAAEHLHLCSPYDLSDSVLPGYLTLTERVLMFLDVHCF